MKLKLLLLVVSVQSCIGFNILGIFPYQGKSHFMVYRVYLRELAKRGHNLSIISHFPEENPPEGYHDVSLAGSIKITADIIPIDVSLLDIFKYLLKSGIENCEVLLANKEVQRVVKEGKFDLVVMEQFTTDCGLGIAYHLGVPVVAMQSSVLMPWQYKRFGIPSNPSFEPNQFLGGGTKPTLYQKFERLLVETVANNAYYYITQKANERSLARYFDGIPPLEDLAREIKFLLQYQNFVLTGPRLFPPNVIEVGGYHVPEGKPLKGDLKKFVDEATDGVVYISFGSVVRASTLPLENQQAILEAIKEFPQRYIWKWDDKTLKIDNNKLYIDSWLPQVDILAHPKTLGFYSHAGLGGTTEALHYAVPMIAMPIFGDQPSNAAAIEESGLGIQLHTRDLTKDNLVAALKTVLDPEFRNRAKAVSKAYHDQPISPLDKAVFWTEFAARNSNFTFRAASANVTFVQYYNLDMASVILVVLLVLYSVFKLFNKTGSKTKND